MRFREWLRFDETRYKGLWRQWQNQNPGVPDYVLNQMYFNHIAPGMKNSIASSTTSQTGNTPNPTPSPTPNPTPHRDPLQTQAFEPPTPDQTQYLNQQPLLYQQNNAMAQAPSRVMKEKNMISGVKWPKKPTIVQLHPIYLERASLSRLQISRFGFNPRDKSIRNDTQRFATHKELAAQRPEGTNEPIILVQIGQNYYELIEGYHRVAMYLLQGAPPEDIEAIKEADFSKVDYTKWKPIKLQAFVGQQSNQMVPNQSQQHYPMPTAPQQSNYGPQTQTWTPQQ